MKPDLPGEETLRALIDSAADGIVVIARDGRVVFANSGAGTISGLTQADLPNLTLSNVLAPEELERIGVLRKARHHGAPSPTRYESVLLHTDGRRIPIDISVAPILWANEPADVVIFRDISERKRGESALLHRETVLQALAQVIEILVHSTNWLNQSEPALEILGRAIGAHRVYVWEAHETPDGEVRTINRRSWVDPAVAQGPDPASLEGFPLRASGHGDWFDAMSRGETLASRASDFPDGVREHYRKIGVRAVLSVPIVVDGRVWGVLGLADCLTEREWLAFEIDSLQVLSSIISALIRREKTREALRTSEEQLRAIFEQAPTAIIVVDDQGWCTEANESGCQLFGYTREEILQVQIADVVPPEFLHLAAAHFEQTKRGEVRRVELPFLTKSGRLIHTEMVAKRLSDGRLQALVTDITARRAVEDELRRHDAVLAAITFAAERFPTFPEWEEWIDDLLERIGRAMAADRVFLYENRVQPDGEHVVIRRNAWLSPTAHPYGEPLYGTQYSLRSMGFGPWLAYAGREPWQARKSTLPESVQAVFTAIGARAILLVPIQVEDSWWGVLGLTDCRREREWEDSDVDALRTAANIIGAMIHRRKIESELVESEVMYRSLVEGSDLSIVLLGRDGAFRFANTMASERLGVSSQAICGMTLWDIFPKNEADAQAQLLRDAIDRQEVLVIERPATVRGVQLWHETRINPLIDSEGRCKSALVIISNITERKAIEERLLSYQGRLRSLSSELGTIELRERRRIASELHDRIGQSLAVVKMKLGALRLAAGKGASAAVDDIRAVVDQTIADTRSLTFELNPPILDELGLEPAIEWLLEKFRAQHAIPAEFRDDGMTKPLDLDVRANLFRSVQELLLNVVKHANAGKIVVSAARSGEEIRITVADDGVGFDPGDVMEIGARMAGFGLFSIRERIASIGGRFRGGERAARRNAGRPDCAPRVIRIEGRTHRMTTILLVDDHQLLREGLRSLLTSHPGMSVVGEAQNGRRAVELVKQLRPDIVIMDVTMPELNGVDATRQVKAERPHDPCDRSLDSF